MANLVNLQKISLKNHPEIKEDLIQKFIFEHPDVLGLGELTPIQRERIQPAGGRLDILMGTVDNDARYEIEIQLEGRADGIIEKRDGTWMIDEVKTTVQDLEEFSC